MESIQNNHEKLTAAVYLQVSIISQALIFVTRSMSWSFMERPGVLLMGAFLIAQMVFSNLESSHKFFSHKVAQGSLRTSRNTCRCLQTWLDKVYHFTGS